MKKNWKHIAFKRQSFGQRTPGGGFVVIRNNEVLGVWQARVDALRAGIEKYGNVAFLIKNIKENDIVVNFSRNIQFK